MKMFLPLLVNNQNLLGIIKDRKLNFNDYVTFVTSKRLSVLARLSYYISEKQRRILLKIFIESQSGYCPLVCMLHS